MKSILNKVAISLATLAVMPLAFSASDLHSRVEQLEKQMEQVGTDNAFGGYGANTASARPTKDNNNWYITGDLLYWTSMVGGTMFAYSENANAPRYPIEGRTKDIDFDWGVGFRVGLGYNFCHDNWNLYAEYTYYSGDGDNSVGTGCNDTLIPTRGGVCSNKQTGGAWFAGKAKSSFDMDFQSVDFNLGRDFFVSEFLSLRPLFGVKVGLIDLEQKTQYSCGEERDDKNFCGVNFVSLDNNFIKITEESDYVGVGPEFGIETKWHLAKGFSFFANTMGALLYGYFDVDHKEFFSGDDMRRIDLDANTHKMTPTAQIHAGLAYDIFFDCDRQHFGISLGYDGQYWWRVNQMIKIDDSAPLKYERWSEDMSMHGVTLDLRWDF